jgi:hypothetical protein
MPPTYWEEDFLAPDELKNSPDPAVRETIEYRSKVLQNWFG